MKAKTVAKAAQQAANELQSQLPVGAEYVRKMAGKIDEAYVAFENRDFGELKDMLKRFGHNQPLTLFGAAALAGFALSRFFKSSAQPGQSGPAFQRGN